MRWLLPVLILLVPLYAPAISLQDSPLLSPETMPLPQTPERALPWKVLYSTKETNRKVTFPDGSYSFETTPAFTSDVKALDGKKITFYGFMFPLEQSDAQSDFLIGPYPPSCPFHYHVPPSLIVEVRTKKPIAFTWDGLTVTGTLELAKGPSDVFYILKDAVME